MDPTKVTLTDLMNDAQVYTERELTDSEKWLLKYAYNMGYAYALMLAEQIAQGEARA